MSYIHSGSNSENLYIFGVDVKNISIVFGTDEIRTMPTKVFHKLLQDWHDHCYEDEKEVHAKSKDFSIERGTPCNLWKISSKYWENPIQLHTVTLFYLYETNKFRWQKK